MKNVPYVKQFDANGKITNPITPENPYNSGVSNRTMLRGHERYVWAKLGMDMVRFLQRRTKSSKNKKSIWQNASGPLQTIPLKEWEKMQEEANKEQEIIVDSSL